MMAVAKRLPPLARQIPSRSLSPGSPNEAEPIHLGASTWFNEPVFIVLKALAPVVEQLDLAKLRDVCLDSNPIQQTQKSTQV